MPERERIWFVPERERISAMEQLFTDQIFNSQSTLLYSSVHAQAVIGDKCPFSLQPLQNKQTLLWGGHSPPTLPTPQWGGSQISRRLKKRTYFVTGRRQNSFDRQVSWKRTNFLSETLWKEQIKQWYVWLISGQQLLLFLFYHKTLNTIEDMICMHRQTCFLEYTDGSMCNVDLDLWSHRASYLSRSLTEC